MFSFRETLVIDIIGKKSLSFGEIANKLFKDAMPMDSNIKVNNCVNRINKKCDYHDTAWELIKTKKDNRIVVSREKR